MQVQEISIGSTVDLWVRSKVIKFQLQSKFQWFFIPNFVFVLTNKDIKHIDRYKTYRPEFSICGLGHAPGVGLRGAGGAGGSKT